MLLDSNIIIYAAQPQHAALRQFVAATVPAVSAVSYVEVLGFHRLTASERISLQQFFAAARVLPLDQPILDQAVLLRQQRRMSLGDSLVAATALVHGLTLVTRNVDDFRWVSGLKLLTRLQARREREQRRPAGAPCRNMRVRCRHCAAARSTS